MKTLNGFAVLLIGLIVFICYNQGNSNSFGAPGENAGAPGEMTCAQGGCHDDNPINAGNGTLQIKPTYDGDKTTTYSENLTFNIELSLKDDQMNAAGFQIVAQRTDNNTAVGSFNPQSNQKLSGNNNNHLTHTQTATSFEGNTQTWTIEWEAPSQDVGEIRFYAAANAANNNNRNTGDLIYGSDTTLTYDKSTSTPQTAINEETQVYPNPTKEMLNIHLPAAKQANFDIRLFDMNGKPVETFPTQTLSQTTKSINLPANLEQGAYMLQLSSQNHQLQKTILVQ